MAGNDGGRGGTRGALTVLPGSAAGGAAQSAGVAMVAAAGSAAATLGGLAAAADGELFRCGTAELVGLLSGVDEVRAQTERVLVALALESLERGLHTDAGMSLHDFLGLHCPRLSSAERRAVQRVARAVRHTRNAAVREALGAGEITIARADVLLRGLERIHPWTDADVYAKDVALLLPVAATADPKDLHTVIEHLIAAAVPEDDREARAQAAHRSRRMYESSLAGGMRRFIIEADAEGAALIGAVLASVLTKPCPTGDEPDERTRSQRCYDALLSVLERGMSHPEGAPTTAKCSLMLTVPYDVLAGRLAAAGIPVHDAAGTPLTAGQLRRLACNADIIPAVLGGESQLLDLGRTHRLVTPGLWRALVHRDGGCTFPGCTMPAQWTEAHHATLWWSRGGATALHTMALLCRRHHTWVHEHDPDVSITDTDVTWHLDRCHHPGPGHAASLHTDEPATTTWPREHSRAHQPDAGTASPAGAEPVPGTAQAPAAEEPTADEEPPTAAFATEEEAAPTHEKPAEEAPAEEAPAEEAPAQPPGNSTDDEPAAEADAATAAPEPCEDTCPHPEGAAAPPLPHRSHAPPSPHGRLPRLAAGRTAPQRGTERQPARVGRARRVRRGGGPQPRPPPRR